MKGSDKSKNACKSVFHDEESKYCAAPTIQHVGISPENSALLQKGKRLQIIQQKNGGNDFKNTEATVVQYDPERNILSLELNSGASGGGSDLIMAGSRMCSLSPSNDFVGNIEETNVEWHRGQAWAKHSEYIGKQVRYFDGTDEKNGSVWGWLPAGDSNNTSFQCSVWKIRPENKEDSDQSLEEGDVEKAIESYSQWQRSVQVHSSTKKKTKGDSNTRIPAESKQRTARSASQSLTARRDKKSAENIQAKSKVRNKTCDLRESDLLKEPTVEEQSDKPRDHIKSVNRDGESADSVNKDSESANSEPKGSTFESSGRIAEVSAKASQAAALTADVVAVGTNEMDPEIEAFSDYWSDSGSPTVEDECAGDNSEGCAPEADVKGSIPDGATMPSAVDTITSAKGKFTGGFVRGVNRTGHSELRRLGASCLGRRSGVYPATRPVIVDERVCRLPVRLLNAELTCPICLSICQSTHTFMECLHRFCQECIEKYLRLGQKECPKCRVKVSSRRALRPDPAFDALIRTLYPDMDYYEAKEDEFISQVNAESAHLAIAVHEGLIRQAFCAATVPTPASTGSTAASNEGTSNPAVGGGGGSAGANRRSGGDSAGAAPSAAMRSAAAALVSWTEEMQDEWEEEDGDGGEGGDSRAAPDGASGESLHESDGWYSGGEEYEREGAGLARRHGRARGRSGGKSHSQRAAGRGRNAAGGGGGGSSTAVRSQARAVPSSEAAAAETKEWENEEVLSPSAERGPRDPGHLGTQSAGLAGQARRKHGGAGGGGLARGGKRRKMLVAKNTKSAAAAARRVAAAGRAAAAEMRSNIVEGDEPRCADAAVGEDIYMEENTDVRAGDAAPAAAAMSEAERASRDLEAYMSPEEGTEPQPRFAFSRPSPPILFHRAAAVEFRLVPHPSERAVGALRKEYMCSFLDCRLDVFRRYLGRTYGQDDIRAFDLVMNTCQQENAVLAGDVTLGHVVKTVLPRDRELVICYRSNPRYFRASV